MFEKAVRRRADRRIGLGPREIAASVGAHVLVAAAIVATPPGQPTPVSTETATILLLYSPPPPPAPALPRQVRAPARTRTLQPGLLRAAAPTPEPQRPRDAVEPLLRAPVVAVLHPGDPPALDLARLRGLGEAGAVPDSGASRAGAAGSAGTPVVDAGVLAEPPQMVNRHEIAQVLGRLYPFRFRVRGTEGEVVMMFIIGLDGRAEMDSVQILSATDPGFVEPTLKGLARMRFRPAALNGVPVRVRATLPVTWILGGS
ncbi:MAG TPA: energy transducer TonB [Longimicrobium sp.]